MEELNPTNAFGEILLDLIEAQFSGDYDTGLAAIGETTGLAEEEVVAIVQGETIVDSADLLGAIVEAFPDADEEDVAALINVAAEVEAEDREALVDNIDAAEDEVEMSEEGMEEDMGADYGYAPSDVASFSYLEQTNRVLNNRVEELENNLASFGYAEELKRNLAQLDRVASEYVNADLLPPSYKAMLVGNFSDDNERLAKFSNIATQNGVDVPTMLFAAQFALSLFTDAANFVEFRDYGSSEDAAAIANFNASWDQVAQEDLKAIFG